MSYLPRLAKVVNVLALRQVKQGTGSNRFHIVPTLSVNMLTFHFNRLHVSVWNLKLRGF